MSYAEQTTAIAPVVVEIGGTPTLLISDNPSFQAMVEERYSEFVRAEGSLNSGRPPLRFEVEVLPDGELCGDEDVRVWKDGDCWHACRGDFRAEVDLQSGAGRIRLGMNPYALNSILRIVHTLYLAPRRGFLLHAASAIRNRAAFVFSGVSGAGKTTISRCAPADAVLLTDEISYIRWDGGLYSACGTPFAGDLGKPGENVSAPIAKLFFLEKGADNRIEVLDKAEAIRKLLRNILFFCEGEEPVQQVFDSACDFIERVPVYRLTFVPDATVWELVG
jgi:hypothetical protein